MFLISIKGKFNILVKISDLQNFISYQKPDFMKFQCFNIFIFVPWSLIILIYHGNLFV